MTALNHSIALRLPGPDHRSGALAVGGAALLLGMALALAAYRYPPPSLGLMLAAGVAGTGVLALAVARYDAAVALGFMLLGVVRIEPAPPDAVFGIVMAVAFVTGRFRLDRVPMAVFASLGALLSLNLLSMVGAVNPQRAALFLTITLYLAVFSIWLAGYVDSARRARVVVGGYLFAAAISAALGAAGLLIGLGGEQFVFAETRAQGLFKDVNVFGPFMVPILLILLEETLSPRLLKMRRGLKLAFIFLLGLGILLSYSRAAWLNCGIGVVVLLLVLGMRRGGGMRVLPLLLIVVGSIGVGSLVLSASGENEFLEQRTSLQSYDTNRFGAQEAGIGLAETHPLGVGPGQFENQIRYSAHSTFVRVFAEQGFLGIMAFVALILATLIFAARNAALGHSAFGIGSAALLAAWCGLLANSFFVDTLHWRHLWIVAALIWVATMRPGQASGSGGLALRSSNPLAARNSEGRSLR